MEIGWLIAILAGYLIGLVQNGVRVTINHNHRPSHISSSPEDYNEVILDSVPQNIRNHTDKTNGYNDF